jgi:hypothetical protein
MSWLGSLKEKLLQKLFVLIAGDSAVNGAIRHTLTALGISEGLKWLGVDPVVIARWMGDTASILTIATLAAIGWAGSRWNKKLSIVLVLFLALPVAANAQAGRTLLVSATPTLDTNAYAAGDEMGTVLTFTGFARGMVGSSKIAWGMATDKAGQSVDFKLHLFTASPSTDSSDNGALDFADSSLVNYLCTVNFNVHEVFADNAVHYAQNVGCDVSQSPGSGDIAIYGQLEAEGAYDAQTSTDLKIILAFEQD